MHSIDGIVSWHGCGGIGCGGIGSIIIGSVTGGTGTGNSDKVDCGSSDQGSIGRDGDGESCGNGNGSDGGGNGGDGDGDGDGDGSDGSSSGIVIDRGCSFRYNSVSISNCNSFVKPNWGTLYSFSRYLAAEKNPRTCR
jgi:hypothetical protein